MTQKFIEGIFAYTCRWPGFVTVMIEVANDPDDNLDHIELNQDELPFKIEEKPLEKNILRTRLLQAAIVLSDGGYDTDNQVIVTEYTLTTRIQMINALNINFIRKSKRILQTLLWEWKFKKYVKKAVGLQCNGTPTFNVYKKINKNSILYFDNRIQISDIISSSALNSRIKDFLDAKSIRLAFSGRLIPSKGVLHLPEIAQELKSRNIKFKMDIFGDGELLKSLKSRIAKLNLEKYVNINGVLPFREGLIPKIQKDVDLFICPHIQGDPSCTYIETLACGIPIVGYSNEAWSGLLSICKAGWSTPIGNISKICDVIENLYFNREKIQQASILAKNFAELNHFEFIMNQRVNHLQDMHRIAKK